MEYWLRILREEERKIKDCEDRLKEENNPRLDSHIQDLERTDQQIRSVLDTKDQSYPVGEILNNPGFFEVFAESVSNYIRALFKIRGSLDNTLIDAIMHLMNGKYKDVGLVAHYDGRIFSPRNVDHWHEIKDLEANGVIAFYAYKPDGFSLAKAAVDVMGGVIGDELEIPFLDTPNMMEPAYTGNLDSHVERLASSEYRLVIRPKEPITFNACSIDAIIDRATLPNSNQVNSGSVGLFYENRRYNVKNVSSFCQLKGKRLSELSFVFRGGYLKDTAHAIFDYLCPSKIDS